MDTSAPSPSTAPAGFDALMAVEAPAGAMDAPAARRNARPLFDVLRQELPATGTVLEVGSGTGHHAAAFARDLHPVRWLPTENTPERRASIEAWSAFLPADGPRPLAPRALDASLSAEEWPVADCAPFDGMVSVNVIHIAPWAVARGLLAGAARWLRPGAPLVLYGPFHRDGRSMSPGNTAFDADLRRQDPDWGIRDLEREVLPLAAACGLKLAAVHTMPANNLCVVLRN
ncbi:DUF938 domain-containing protein [Thalassobaculum sp. OXR-137]|uniref:DUF938 domain-containing protein n=1 Tax=Thalassobaculum sp. OXR-137 TaxID=3100173 RepID=UPI002AC898BE|nr:DUF938 domain-containing protein [Thalassobaculum sp. OXR-137]WPZ34275.1 DUF938 domain-containing protein [Thalassobaculum sp. OXR-137]